VLALLTNTELAAKYPAKMLLHLPLLPFEATVSEEINMALMARRFVLRASLLMLVLDCCKQVNGCQLK
jgi:hypothetical protein